MIAMVTTMKIPIEYTQKEMKGNRSMSVQKINETQRKASMYTGSASVDSTTLRLKILEKENVTLLLTYTT